MINFKKKDSCCGCWACVQKCPKQCITMKEDCEGFLYPTIDKSLCINCQLCEKVCPSINQGVKKIHETCLAAKNTDDYVRRQSSSGGIFSLIAEKVISQGGVIFGASFNSNWEVVHTYTESIEGLSAFRGSKYVQSEIGTSYKDAESFLLSGRIVLFSGTPCQIAGLNNYLSRTYSNLITVDFICHGVPSPGVFRWYLQEEINKLSDINRRLTRIPGKGRLALPQGLTIDSIHFRDKTEGWKNYSLTINTTSQNQHLSISSNVWINPFLRGFCSDLYLRPSCHKCPSKQCKSGSDITLGDFWGQEYSFPHFDYDSGVSAVLINTEKGHSIIKTIEHADIVKRPINDLTSYNPSIISSKKISLNRMKFWLFPWCHSFEKRVQISSKTTLFERIVTKINHR